MFKALAAVKRPMHTNMYINMYMANELNLIYIGEPNNTIYRLFYGKEKEAITENNYDSNFQTAHTETVSAPLLNLTRGTL